MYINRIDKTVRHGILVYIYNNQNNTPSTCTAVIVHTYFHSMGFRCREHVCSWYVNVPRAYVSG